MFPALAVVSLAIASGTLLTFLYDEGSSFAARLCAGACIGFALLATVGFIFASVLNLNSLALILATLVVASPLFALFAKSTFRSRVQADIRGAARNLRRAVLHPTKDGVALFLFYVIIATSLWLVFDRVMYERTDGLYTAFVNNIGDLPFHTQTIASFVYGENFPPEDPIYAGARFTYPFLADFFAAMLMRAGADLRTSIFIENFALAIAFVGLIARWTHTLVRDALAARFAPVLVLLSGGLGWWMLWRDVRESDVGLRALLEHLPHDYTILSVGGWRWGNALTTLLVPQRSLLFGLPLAIIIFTQWWLSLESDEESEKQDVRIEKGAGQRRSSTAPFSSLVSHSAKRMVAAGVLTSLLPLIHAHTFGVVIGVGLCLAFLFGRWRTWSAFFIAALAFAMPEMWWATRENQAQAQTFFGWHVGWDHDQTNILLFWLKNTGVFIPLILIALVWRPKGGGAPLIPRRVRLFYLPFTLCFVVPNLITLAPWVWDNIKVLFYWYVASVPLVALLLARWWQRRSIYRALAVALFISLTLAGALDVWRVLSRAEELREFDRDGMLMAKEILQRTPQRALILHAPVYNTPVFLTGRRSLLGYPGHIWSRGLDYVPREADIQSIYAGAADAPMLLAKYKIDYVLISPLEHDNMDVNDSFFERYPKVGEVGEYRLYRIAQR
jgi:hypothetical protein